MMDAMETKERKNGLKAVYRLCPVAHTVALVSAVMILLHLALRGNQPLMARIGSGFLHPMHEKLALLCDKLGRHSAAEALICAADPGEPAAQPLSAADTACLGGAVCLRRVQRPLGYLLLCR